MPSASDSFFLCDKLAAHVNAYNRSCTMLGTPLTLDMAVAADWLR
jgi:hypothetical protein